MDRGGRFSRRTLLSRGAVAGGAIALGATAPALLAGCSSNSASPTSTDAASRTVGVGEGSPARGGSLSIGTLSEIDGFYPPTNHWDSTGFLYANAIFDPLMAVAADGSIQPFLAKSMTPNETFDVWTLTLRPDVKFSDGSDLTAEVVRANFDALARSPLTGAALKQVASVNPVDPETVVFTLTGPNPNYPFSLTRQVGYMVGQAMIEAATSSPGVTPKPIGTGPFVYADWQPNSHFVVTRNPNYWQSGLPYLDSITFRPIPDTTQRESTLRTGAVDMIQSVDRATITRFSGSGGSGYQLVDSRSKVVGQPTMVFIMLNTAVTPTNDLGIRQALAKGLDQAEVQKLLGGPPGQPVNGLFLPGSPFYSDTGYPRFDPDGAKKLVREYTADHGAPTLTLQTIPEPDEIRLVQAVQQMWEQVGFVVTLSEVEQATIINNFALGKFQAATSYGYGAVIPDLNYVWFSSTTVSPVGHIGLNFPRLDDPKIETALVEGRHSNNESTRTSAYRTVNERLARELPYLWIEQYLYSEVADETVQNFNSLTLPDGRPGLAFNEGVFFPAQTWLNM